MKRSIYELNRSIIKFGFWALLVGSFIFHTFGYAQEKVFLSSGFWGGQVDIWDIHHGVMVDSINGVNAWHMITTSDGTKLYTNNEDDDLYIADLIADTLLLNPVISNDAYALAGMELIYNDSLLLVCETEMEDLYVWNVQADTLQDVSSISQVISPTVLAVSSDEQYIYIAGSSGIEKMEVGSFTELIFKRLPSNVDNLIIAPDDSVLYSSGYYTLIINANTLDTTRSIAFSTDKVLLDTVNHRLLGMSTYYFATIDLTTYKVDTVYDFNDTTYQFPVLRDMAFFSGTDSLLLVGPSGMLKLDTKTLQIAGRIDSVNYQRVYVWKAPTVVSVNEQQNRLAYFELYQNYPNPFNPVTTIRFRTEKSDLVKLEVFDLLGRRVKTLLNKRLNSGVHQVRWDGKDELGQQVASGVYFYRLLVGSHAKVRKMILMK
jgi:hypothetical protein